jgi:hypothetical protein
MFALLAEVPEFSTFEIPYNPYWVGGILGGLFVLSVICYFAFAGRIDASLRRLPVLCSFSFLLLFFAWELIILNLGMDSVLGFFLLVALSITLAILVGVTARIAPAQENESETATNQPTD